MERLLPAWCCASLVAGAAGADPVHVAPEAACLGASTRYNWRGGCPMLAPGIGAGLTEAVYWRAVGDDHSHSPRLNRAYAKQVQDAISAADRNRWPAMSAPQRARKRRVAPRNGQAAQPLARCVIQPSATAGIAVLPPQAALLSITLGQLKRLAVASAQLRATIRTHDKRPRRFRHLDDAANSARDRGAQQCRSNLVHQPPVHERGLAGEQPAHQHVGRVAHDTRGGIDLQASGMRPPSAVGGGGKARKSGGKRRVSHGVG